VRLFIGGLVASYFDAGGLYKTKVMRKQNS
jgi:hypothetical protein